MSVARRFKIYLVEARGTLRLGIPLIIGHIGQVLIGTTDSMMVGRVGKVPLAASAFALSLFHLVLVFGMGFSFAISTLVAQAFGGQRNRDCGEVLRHSLLIVFILGLFLVAIIEVTCHFFLDRFGQAPEVVEEARPFLRWVGWSLLPVMIFQALRQFTDGLERTALTMKIQTIAILMNIFLNWIFIYGNWGAPEMGLKGAGVTTFLCRAFMIVALATAVWRSTYFRDYYPLSWFSRLQSALVTKILRVSIPSAFQSLFEVGAFAGSAIMMGWISPTVLAAHQIALNIAALTFMIPLGLSFAASIRIGNAHGRNDALAVRRIGFSSLLLAIFCGSIFTTLFLAGRHLLPPLYISDPAVIQTASLLLILAGIFQIFDGLQAVGLGLLRGLLDIRVPTLTTFVAYWVLALPAGYLMSFHLNGGAAGIWIGLTLGLVFAAFAHVWRFERLSRKT